MESLFNYGHNDLVESRDLHNDLIESDNLQSSTLIPQHLKCGEVFTWLCEGEKYAIQCQLCEDRPLCPLSEFAQHMDIWHTEWDRNSTDREEDNEDLYNSDHNESDHFEDHNDEDHAFSFTTEDSGLFETEDHIQNDQMAQQDQLPLEEILEPFEQVLIEQDNNIDTTIQRSEDVVVIVAADECLADVNKQVAELEECKNEREPKQNVNRAQRRESKHRDNSKDFKETVSKLTELGVDNGKQLEEIIKTESETNGNETTTSKSSKYLRNLENLRKEFDLFQEIDKINEFEPGTSESETGEIETSLKTPEIKEFLQQKPKKSLKILRKSKRQQETTNGNKTCENETKRNELETSENETNQFEVSKIETKSKINKNQRKELKNINKINEFEEGTSESETSSKTFEIIEIFQENPKRSLRNFQRQLRRTNGKESSERNRLETNENETNKSETSGNETKTIEINKSLIKELKVSKNTREINNMKEEQSRNETNKLEISKKLNKDLKISINTRKTTELEKELSGNETINQKTPKKSNEILRKSKRMIKGTKENATNQNKSGTNEIGTSEIKRNVFDTNENETNQFGTSGNKTYNLEISKNQKKVLEVEKNLKKVSETQEELSENETNNQKNSKKLIKCLRKSKRMMKGITENETNEIGTSEIKSKLIKIEIIPSYVKVTHSRIKTNNYLSNKVNLETNKTEGEQSENETIVNEANLKANEKKLKKVFQESNKAQDMRYKRKVQTGTCGNETKLREVEVKQSGNRRKPYISNKVSLEPHETEEEQSEKETCDSTNDKFEEKTVNEDNFEREIKICLKLKKLFEEKQRKSLKNLGGLKKILRKLQENSKETKNVARGKKINEAETSDIKMETTENEMEATENETFGTEIFSDEEMRTNERNIIENLEETSGIETEITEHEDETSAVESDISIIKVATRNYKTSSGICENETEVSNHGMETTENETYLSGNGENTTSNDSESEHDVIKTPIKAVRANLKYYEAGENEPNYEETSESETNIENMEKDFQSSPTRNFRINLKNFTHTKRKCQQKFSKLEQEESSTRISKRKPKHSESETKNLVLKSPMKSSLESNKKRTSEEILGNQFNDTLSPAKRSKSGRSRSSLVQITSKSDPLPKSEQDKQDKVINLKDLPDTNEKILGNLVASKEASSLQREKQTLLTHFFGLQGGKEMESSEEKTLENPEHLTNDKEPTISKTSNMEPSATRASSSLPDHLYLCEESLSPPLSPKTEEEDFEFYEPKTKLNSQHIRHLLQLYKERPRLWDQSHPDFCEPHVCRKSWQQITEQWNAFCQRKFSTAEVRIRLGNLCQRYVQERERLDLEGELDEFAKFAYFEDMHFLEQQKSLQKRRDLYDLQNDRIVELYQNFPLLWHVGYYKMRKAKEKAQAFESISQCLKVIGLHLSANGVEKRIRSLRKCYRLEKIRYLHSQVEQIPFDSEFRHYERMDFLHKHIDPFVCGKCGKIFENLVGFREHLMEEKHGNVLQDDSESEGEGKGKEFDYKASYVKQDARSFKNKDQSLKEVLVSPNMDFISENEETSDILQRLRPFSPISSTTSHQTSEILQSFTPLPPSTPIPYSENAYEVIQRYSPMPLTPSPISDEASEVLQTFTPLSSNPSPVMEYDETVPYMETLQSPSNEDIIIFSCHTPASSPMDCLSPEDHLIEEIMDAVSHDDSLTNQSLDQFINSAISREDRSPSSSGNLESLEPVPFGEQADIISIGTLSPQMNTDFEVSQRQNALVENQSNIVEDQILISGECPDLEETVTTFTEKFINSTISREDRSPSSSGNLESLEPVPFREQADIISIGTLSPQMNTDFEVSQRQNALVENQSNIVEDQILISGECPDLEETVTTFTEKLPKTSSSVVKVTCPDFSSELNINAETLEVHSQAPQESDNEFYSSADISTIPLPDHQIHEMIKLYRKYPQLWNPNHLDYNSRTLKRQAWCNLTTEFNNFSGKQFSWRTMHRKLTDYAKYYKKLIMEQENSGKEEIKWTFFNDFKYLDDVIAVHDELQRSVHHRDSNLKIIKIYETLPQLWDIKNSDYSKRCIKQRNFELMCQHLQEDYNLQITTERLKHRLIDLRAQYRLAKKQRLKSEKLKKPFQTDFEFYEALHYLDPHIDPFVCEPCQMEFKRLTDFNRHIKREHDLKPKRSKRKSPLLPLKPRLDKDLQNICHICGVKVTSRSNLANHVRRHEGIRNFSCSICSKKFFASHALKVHMRSHTKECPYTCEKCGASFVSASKLNQHTKRHLNQKEYQCKYCPKNFYTGYEKDRHERRHLNIRDKICPICGKTFVAGSSYYAHMMLHNDTKRFECDKCDLKFAQYAGLYKHKKRYHQ